MNGPPSVWNWATSMPLASRVSFKFVELFGTNAGDREYGIRFNSFDFRAFAGEETPVRGIDAVNVLRMDLNFLPAGTQVTGGGVELIVNDIHIMFKVTPQVDTNAPDGRPGFPYMVLATNLGGN